ncbi:MAG: 50S ribosomal protein L28 [Spirochaetales bacterium]|nr:50S ribosomal protein L28 [Spirochaetales bacterium]
MARVCELCGRGTISGQNVPRKGLSRKKGGGGVKIGVRTKRTFKVNLFSKVIDRDGSRRKTRICSRCLRSHFKEKV